MIKTTFFEIFDTELNTRNLQVFSSLEGHNPGGSIKDHMVYNELKELIDKKQLEENSIVSEVSSGSTALSLATWCPHFKLQCSLFVPENTPKETIENLKALGASVFVAPMQSIYQEHDLYQKLSHSYFFNQLWDHSKSRHYQKLGKFLQQHHGPFHGLIGAVGTGHSLKGLCSGMSPDFSISCEPTPDYKIPGIRNLDSDRYGELDLCLPENFTKRVFISQEKIFKSSTVNSNIGLIQIGRTFQIVMSGLRTLSFEKPTRIFAIAADSRRH